MAIIVYLLFGATSLVGAVVGEINVYATSDDTGTFDSVEIGLGELSPLGEAGGYAVPASGDSDCPCTSFNKFGDCLNYSCPDPTINSPTANLEYRVKSGGSWGSWRGGNVTINDGDQIRLRWSSTYASSCASTGAGSGRGTFSTGGATSGVDTTIGEPNPGQSTKFRVACSGIGDYSGTTAADTVTVTTRTSEPEPGTPTVTLYQKVNNLGSYSSADATIDSGDQVRLHWVSGDATSCTSTGVGATTGGFSTGGKTIGTDITINEPAAGSSMTFRVSCTGPGGTIADTLKITTSGILAPGTPTLSVTRSCTATDGKQNNYLSWNAVSGSPHYHIHGCTGAACTNWAGITSTNGTSYTHSNLDDNTVYRYRLRAHDHSNNTLSGYSYANASSLNCTTPPPGVTLEARNITQGSGWTGGSITIDPIDDIQLRWSSTNATSCSASSNPTGGNFATGGATSGTDSTINEPAAGENTIFRVACTGSGGNAQGDLMVSTSMGGIVTLDADPDIVRVGDPTNITWNVGTNDPASCILTGPGVNISPLPSSDNSSDPYEVPVYGESTFLLDCPGDDDTVTVRVLPVVEET